MVVSATHAAKGRSARGGAATRGRSTRLSAWAGRFLLAPFGLLCGLLLAPPASAAETARHLATQCQRLEDGVKHAGKDLLIPHTKDALQCWGYMQAMQDLSVLTNENGNRLMGTCPGEQTTLLQITQAFTGYARQHPDKLDNDAAVVVIEALQAAFPCPPSNASLQNPLAASPHASG